MSEKKSLFVLEYEGGFLFIRYSLKHQLRVGFGRKFHVMTPGILQYCNTAGWLKSISLQSFNFGDNIKTIFI